MITEGRNHKLAIDQIESLRLILKNEQNREISQSEAVEIGQSLIDFFELLVDRTTEAEA